MVDTASIISLIENRKSELVRGQVQDCVESYHSSIVAMEALENDLWMILSFGPIDN